MNTMQTYKTYSKIWPGKVLGELVYFLGQRHPEGIPVKEVAEKLGVTAQYVSYIFLRDDLRLSGAEKIANLYGYELHLYFPQRRFPEGIEAPEHTREYPKAGNLRGLAEYMLDSNWTPHALAQMTGCSYHSLLHAFETGDIMISKLRHIEESLDIQILWKFDEKQES